MIRGLTKTAQTITGTLCLAISLLAVTVSPAFPVITIGLNYPETGPYSNIGLDQRRAVKLALSEINDAGGLLGHRIRLVTADTQSRGHVAAKNAARLIEEHNVSMLLGGVSSSVAIEVGKVANEKKRLFMATVTAANATTDTAGQRYMFRTCYNAWMGARALGRYLTKKFKNKTYFYITADYSWGWSTEESIRSFTHTTDSDRHGRVLTKLGTQNFKEALLLARSKKPDVLVLILFGKDMQFAIRQASILGLKKQAAIVVPILELSMAEGAGPRIMEDVIGTCDFNWKIPEKYNYKRGRQFVSDFKERYFRYPCWGAATAYTAIMQWKSAVNRTQSFDSATLVKALEGHAFSLLKNKQRWRAFDHQNVQDVFLIQCKKAVDVVQDPLGQDFFQVLERIPGKKAVRSRKQWNTIRQNHQLDTRYGPL